MAPLPRIRSLLARPVLVPFKRPPVSASGGIPAAALVLVDLETDAGVTGRSYVFGFTPWTLKSIAASICSGSRPCVTGWSSWTGPSP